MPQADPLSVTVAQRYSLLVRARNDTGSDVKNWVIHANMEYVFLSSFDVFTSFGLRRGDRRLIRDAVSRDDRPCRSFSFLIIASFTFIRSHTLFVVVVPHLYPPIPPPIHHTHTRLSVLSSLSFTHPSPSPSSHLLPFASRY